MKIKILKVSTKELVIGTIIKSKTKLPSINDGWRFNFEKHSKRLPFSETFILVTEETPDVIEGCMIFQMLNNTIPYLAFLEVAPHNQTVKKKYDLVAGCLMAYAFKLSTIKGKGVYKSQLFLEVLEEDAENEKKLILHYRMRYGAKHIGDNQLVIIDGTGYKLIEKYLNN